MPKEIACGDVVQGCTFHTSAANEDELLRAVAEHARQAHGVTEVSPDLLAKVKGAIKDTEVSPDLPAKVKAAIKDKERE